MKLRDVLLKPIGKISAKDGIDIIRPNGDVKDAENECCIYIGDRVKNTSDKSIALIINEREITLEPGQVTTVIPITYGVIQKIAKLQDEIVNGKTIEELENSAAGKELIKELSSLGEAIFEHSGHYSNIHASTDTIDFIKNIKQLEAAPSREPNIYENPNPISAPLSAPRIETPTHNIHGAEPKVEPKPEPKPEPVIPFTKDHVVFIEDANGNGTLTVDENGNPFLFTTVRIKFPGNVRAFDIINVAKDDGSWTDGKVVTNVADGYVEFDMPIQNDFGKRVKLVVEHLNQNGDHIATVTNGLNIDKLPPLDDITFPEDANGDGTLGLAENATNPNSTTVRVGIPSYSGSGDIITIKDKDGTTTLGSATLTPTDKTKGYVEINVPVTKGKTLEIAVDLEHSTIKTKPTQKSLVIESDPMPKLKATDITFTEDANSDGKLTPAENTTTPTTTTVKITLPDDVKVGDKIKIADKNGTYSDSHVITTSDKTNGHISFEAPATKGKTIDAEVKVERDGEDGGSSHKTLKVFQPMGMVSLSATEDADGDLELTDAETADPAHTNVRVTLDSNVIVGDKVHVNGLKAGSTETKVHTVTATDITRGYIDFEAELKTNDSGNGEFHARGWLERGSETSANSFLNLTLKFPVPGLPVRTFLEDTSGDNKLQVLENTTDPDTTTLAIAIDTSTVKVGDVIKVKDSNNASYTGTHTVTTADFAPGHGYITFEMPAIKGKTIDPKITITRGSKTWGPDIYSIDDLEIETDPRDQISLSIDPINVTGHITDADLSHRTIKAVIRVNHKELLNDGYEIEVKVYDKTIKAYKQADGTYAADIRLADYKDDADQKITATLKNATVDMDDGSSHSIAMPVAEKTAEASYDTNFTRSVLDILNVNDYNVMTLADIKNDADVHINGEVRGIYYKTGDNVFLTLPNGNIITANVQADGTFSATVKPSALGYPTTTNPTSYSNKIIGLTVSGKYTNDTGTYNDTNGFNVSLERSLFGLQPTIVKANNNDSGITFKEVGGIDASLNTEEAEKYFNSANGGKVKLSLNFKVSTTFSGGYDGGYETIRVPSLGEETSKSLSKAMNGWKYEVYIKTGELYQNQYEDQRFENRYAGGTTTKVLEGTIVDGKIVYEHDVDLKTYLPSKTGHNNRISFFTKIVPPAGDNSFVTITSGGKATTLSAKVEDNYATNKYSNGSDAFSNKMAIFEKVVSDEPNKEFGLITESASGNTFYYTSGVDKIDIGGFVFNKTDNSNAPDSTSVWNFWADPTKYPGSPISKPKEAYTIINGHKYTGTIDPVTAKVIFKDISTSDLKNDSDHTYELVLSSKDAYGNDVLSKRSYTYTVIDDGAKTQSEIENAFVLTAKDNALEVYARRMGNDYKAGIFVNNFSGYDGEKVQLDDQSNDSGILTSTKNNPRLLLTLENKYVSHLDHDITLKLESVVTNPSVLGKLYWYDPSENIVKEIVNGEINIKAGTHFKDIKIVQVIHDNDELNYDSEVTGVNEYGVTITDGSMSLKKQNVTFNLKNSGGTTISTATNYIADTDYDININANGNVDLGALTIGNTPIDGNRKIVINNTQSSYAISGGIKAKLVPIEFKNESVNVDIGNDYFFLTKKFIFNKGNNVINSGNNIVDINGLESSMTPADIAAHATNTLTINRNTNTSVTIRISNDASHSYHGLQILRSAGGGKPITLRRPELEDSLQMVEKGYIKDFVAKEDVALYFYSSAYTREVGKYYLDNFRLEGDGTFVPTLSSNTIGRNVKDSDTYINNSIIAGNIENASNLIIDNSTIGIAGQTTKMTLQGNLTLNSGATFAGPIDVEALGGTTSYNNQYVIDTTIDKVFNLTDTTITNGGTNKFTFGSHANVGNHANFNVDNSELIFESGSEFHGKVKAGSGNNSITIKSGATFDGTIDMGDSISNIVIEQGAHLGPNFHIGETGTGNEQTSGKYDTLTIFDDLDFNNVDVRGIEQINIGTKARGEMINLDLAYSELANLMRGNSGVIKFWGDNDNHLTFHNEANRTFSVAADQSAVASQPYTRYEASDTASGTKYFIDVHNDINLQIL